MKTFGMVSPADEAGRATPRYLGSFGSSGVSQEMDVMLLWNIRVLFSESQKAPVIMPAFRHFCTITASGEQTSDSHHRQEI